MTFPPAQFAQLKPFPCLDVGGIEIPAFSMLEITDFSVNFEVSVKRPSDDSLTGIVCMSGPQVIPANGRGVVYIGMGIATYTGGPPVVDEIWGTDTDSFLLTAKKGGFKIIGVDTSLGLAAIREFGIPDVFFKDFTFTDSEDPTNSQYSAGATSVTAEEVIVDGGAGSTKVVIMELASAMEVVAALHLVASLSSAYVADTISSPDAAPNHQASATFNLIKTELTGALAIDQLTHNDLGSLAMDQLTPAVPMDWTGDAVGVTQFEASDLSCPGGQNVVGSSVLNTGPYFGLRIDVEGSTSFTKPPDVLTTQMVISDTTPDATNPLTRSMAKPGAFYGL